MGGDSSCNNLLNGSVGKEPSGFEKNFLICTIVGGSLIIKLNIVKINETSNLFINSEISAFWIVLVFEKFSFRRVGDDMIWKQFSQFPSEFDQPFLSKTSAHLIVIFIINITSIQIIR